MSTVASLEVLSREELLEIIDEQSAPLGYRAGEFIEAVRTGTVPDTAETSKILVLVRLVA
jgi:hypothetical protein